MQNLPKNVINAILAFLVIVSLFFAIKTLAEIKSYRFIGESQTPSTISFEGKGEVFASPDIATISFSVRSEAKTMKAAQDVVTGKVNQALKFLKDNGIADKDIKTTNYSSYPKYEYTSVSCFSGYCPPGKQVLTGFEVSQNIEVKIRNIDDSGKIVEGLASVGVTDMNGPNFTIDDEDELKDQARELAIEDAKEKAQTLAKDLGVRLIRIVSFSESSSPYYPIYGMKAEFGMGGDSFAPAPSLPTGENKITSNVTITYEIR